MKTRFLILFFLTLSLLLILRIYLLTQTPEGFDQTEAAFGYNAYSILRTGRDEYGKIFPLVLTSIGDYKLAGYMYWQIPFIALIGLNEFSVRFATAVAGIISLFFVYDIVLTLSKSRKLALLTFFFTGISPWHIILSRMGYDPIVALMFCLLSFALFIRWHRSGKLFLLLLSALALCWGIATYYAVWVILPLILIFYLTNIFKQKKTAWLPAAIILLLPLIMTIKLLFLTQGQRLNQDSTFQTNAYPLLQEQIREDGNQFPLLLTRAFHNKLFFYPQYLLQNLFNNFSFDFLFLRGDKFDRRFYVPYQGVLYLMTAPLVLLGFLYFWKNRPVVNNLFLQGAILVIFLGSAFSEFGSETERTIFAIPIFCFFISYGLITVYAKLRHHFRKISTIFPAVIGLSLGINVANFNHQYYWHANVHEPWGRNFGMREMLSLLPSLKNNYQEIVIPDSAYIFYYFYNQVDPKTAWLESGYRLNKANFLGLKLRAKIGSFLTMPIDCPAAGKLQILYVCQGTSIPKNSRVIKVIRFSDDQPAFIFLEFTTTPTTELPPKYVRFKDKSGLIDDKSQIYWQDEHEVMGN